MSKTSHFQFTAFGDGLHPKFLPAEEANRWNRLDDTLGSQIALVGDGVISGLVPSISESNALAVEFTPGDVFVSGFYGVIAETQGLEGIDLTDLISADGYIYAQLTATTYYDASLTIGFGEDIPADAVGLCYVEYDILGVAITALHWEDEVYTRQALGVTDALKLLLTAHQHTGVDGMPSKVNLAEHVWGVLDKSHLPSDIPASKVTGTLAMDAVSISHRILTSIGIYDHDQLDEFYQFLMNSSNVREFERYGLVNIVNRLKHTLTLLRLYDTDTPAQRLYNERPIIPGITDDAWIYEDSEDGNLATIDKTNHEVTIAPALQRKVPIPATSVWSTLGDTNIGEDLAAQNLGFNGETKLPFPDTFNVRIGEDVTGAYVRLESESERNIYKAEGYLYVRVEAPTVVQWADVQWTVGPTGLGRTGRASFGVQAKVSNDPRLAPPADWGADTEDATIAFNVSDQAPAKYLWVRCHFKASSDGTETPVLTRLSVSYDGSSSDRCAALIYNNVSDWLADLVAETVSAGIIFDETACGESDVHLSPDPLYYSEGVYTSPVFDAGASYVWWSKAFVSYTLGSSDASIRADIRTAAYPFQWDSTDGWQSIPFSDAMDLSGYHDQYLQLRLTLTPGDDNRQTPEVLGISLAYYTESQGSPQTRAFIFAKTGTDIESWGWDTTGGNGTNIDAASFKGAITVLDTDAGEGRWVSPPLAVEGMRFLNWSEARIVGEDIQNVSMQFEFSDDAMEWTKDPHPHQAGSPTSDFSVDLEDPANTTYNDVTIDYDQNDPAFATLTNAVVVGFSTPPFLWSQEGAETPYDPALPDSTAKWALQSVRGKDGTGAPVGSTAVLGLSFGGTADESEIIGLAAGGVLLPGNVAYGMVWKNAGIKTGGTWEPVTAPVPVSVALPYCWSDMYGMYATYVHSEDVMFVGGANGKIYKSADGGATWTKVNDGTGVSRHNYNIGRIHLHTDGLHGVAIASNTYADYNYYDGTCDIWLTTDGGDTWTHQDTIPTEGSGTDMYGSLLGALDCVMVPGDATGHTILIAGCKYVLRSTNSGSTWTKVINNANFYGVNFSLVTDPDDNDNDVVMLGSNVYTSPTTRIAVVYRSSDDGATWGVVYNGDTGVDIPRTKMALLYSASFRDTNNGIVIGTVDNSTTYWKDGSAGVVLTNNDIVFAKFKKTTGASSHYLEWHYIKTKSGGPVGTARTRFIGGATPGVTTRDNKTRKYMRVVLELNP